MNVLWLASWYPNKTDFFNGDFIERHAKAVAPFVNSLTVIAAVKDDKLSLGSSEVECKVEGNITTYIIYYGRSRWGETIEKLFSGFMYMSLQRQLFKKILAEKGKPDIVHVHIAMKAGLFARELKRKYNIPYIVTEQWTGYFKIARPNIFSMDFLFRRFTKSILQNAALLLPVSDYLGKAINADITAVKYITIPNVVDTSVFFPVNHPENEILQLVHISVLGYQKNAEAMIEALSIYKSRKEKFLLQIFGPPPTHIVELVKEKNLEKEIIFRGEVTQPELAPALQAADALVLYSRYETFGCVLIEANACGVPVIVSKFPVFDEFIMEGVNGVFAEGDNPEALATALENFYHHRNDFNKEKIAADTKERFCYGTVGKIIAEVYKKYARQS
jgi:glycosyltransferase involved in cell wall biosynthesis